MDESGFDLNYSDGGYTHFDPQINVFVFCVFFFVDVDTFSLCVFMCGGEWNVCTHVLMVLENKSIFY